jgi:peptide/nickel transport system substrate-binding protein
LNFVRAALALIVPLLLAGASPAAPLRIVTQILPDTRGNPHSYGGLPFGLVNHAVFEPLVRNAPGGHVLPALAESWVQESPRVWVFTLRADVAFSNGEPFDAAAVAAATDYLLGTPLPVDALPANTLRTKVARVTVRDDRTVAFETKAIDPILPLHMASLRIPAPGAWAKGIDAFAASPVGSGPYRVVSWAPAAVRLASNDRARTPGRVAEIEVRAIPDQTARALALASGTADIAIDVPAEAEANLPDGGYRLAPRTASMVSFLQFVTVNGSPLADVRVRRALNYAVDKQRLIASFLAGAVKPATQFTHEDAFGYNTDLAAYPYDPDRTRALLAEAGAVTPDGKRLVIPAVFVGGAGADTAIYQQLSSDFAAVGVDLQLRPLTLPIWMGHLFAGDWPGWAFVTGVQGYDPVIAFTTRSCEWAKPHHCDPDLMPLLHNARAAETTAELETRIRALMAYERDNPPGLLLWRRASFDGLGPRVKTYDASHERVDFPGLEAVE